MQKNLIVGNWKMNITPSQSIDFVKSFQNTKNKAIICVPYVCFTNVYSQIKDTNIKLGAQNMYFEEKGAYTGEISPSMLKDCGVSYVILGHSERRSYFAETDDIINKKIIKSLEHNLTPILCVGETLAQNENNSTFDVISSQIKLCLQNVDPQKIKQIIIAYEPIWAIGTGKTASTSQAEKMCKFIRDLINELYGIETSNSITILYGGSININNVSEIFSMDNINGGLIGGASITNEFLDILAKIK